MDLHDVSPQQSDTEPSQVIIAGHPFIKNLRRGHYELGLDVPPAPRIAAAFTELAHAI